MTLKNAQLVTVTDIRIEPRSQHVVLVFSNSRARGLEIATSALPIILAFCSTSTVAQAFASAGTNVGLSKDVFEKFVERCLERGVLVYADNRDALPTRLRVYQEALDRAASSGYDPDARALRSPIALQGSPDYYPGLAAKEFHDVSRFEWAARLEEKWVAIDQELEGLLSEEPNLFRSVHRDFTERGGWASAYFWSHGEMDEEVCERCPVTTKMIREIPGTTEIGTVMFSVLGPQTRLAPHCGPTNTRLRCQLPLRVPGDCVLRVGDYHAELEEGRCLIFDDSFLHSAWNNSDEPRFVLLLDLFHPDLEASEIEFLVAKTRQDRPGLQYLKAAPQDQPEWVRRAQGKSGDV